MHISARVDYAMRALMALTEDFENNPKTLLKADQISESQDIPFKFLESILVSLRNAGIVASVRGKDGGYRLDRNPSEISVADVMRALEGPLAEVRGQKPEAMVYNSPSENVKDVWVATRAALRSVLEDLNLQDIYTGKLPAHVKKLNSAPDAWKRR